MAASGLKADKLGVHGLKGVDFKLSPGQCAGLTGPSGAGKTLLLRALADLDPHQGQVWLDGVAAEAIDVNQWRRQVGLLPSQSAWWHDTVGPHFTNPDDRLMAALGFGREVLEWQIAKLSSGERQRLALLRLLMQQPKVLLLDEPTANLDAENIHRAESLLDAYRIDHKAAILWVSHDLEQLNRNCSVIYTIHRGRLISAACGSPAQGPEAR
ncbi:MAG: ABC transporter ATP-binding protein [Desulfobacteraceae bacterium]|jgi:ABC-type multidrug transport system ATPase subunit